MTRLVIFDLDGTLLDTLDDLAVSVNYALRQHHYPEHELEEYRYFVGDGITKLIERALPSNARQEEIILQLRQEFITYYQQHKTDLSRPYPGITELLRSLHTQGILLAVASNKYHQGTVELVHHFFDSGLFTIISGQKEKVPVKPHPAIVEDILVHTGVKKTDTLYVGDSGVDMQTARNSGLTSIGVTWGFRPRQELENNRAHFIVNTPAEIEKIINLHS